MILFIFTLFFTIVSTTHNSTIKPQVLPYWKFHFCEHQHKYTTERRLPDVETEMKWQNECTYDCGFVNAYFIGDGERAVELICYNRLVKSHMNKDNTEQCECIYSSNPRLYGGRSPGHQYCNPPKIFKNIPLLSCDIYCKKLIYQVYRPGNDYKLHLALCDNLLDLKLTKATGIIHWDMIPSEKRRTCHCGLHYDPKYMNLLPENLSFPAVSLVTENLKNAGLIGSKRGNNIWQSGMKTNPVISSSQVRQYSGKRPIIPAIQPNKNILQHLSRTCDIESSSNRPVMGQPPFTHHLLQDHERSPSTRNIQSVPQKSSTQDPTCLINTQTVQGFSQQTEIISLESRHNGESLMTLPSVPKITSQSPSIILFGQSLSINHMPQVPQSSSSLRDIQRTSEQPLKFNPASLQNSQIAQGLSQQTEKISLESGHDGDDQHPRLGQEPGAGRELLMVSPSVSKSTSVTLFGQSLPTHQMPQVLQSSSGSRNVQPAIEQSLKLNPASLNNTESARGLSQQTEKISLESGHDGDDLHQRLGQELGPGRELLMASQSLPKSTSVTLFGQSLPTHQMPRDSQNSSNSTNVQNTSVTLFGQSLPTHQMPRDSQNSSNSTNVQPPLEQSPKQNTTSLVNTQIVQGLSKQTEKISLKSDRANLHPRLARKSGPSSGQLIPSPSLPKHSTSLKLFGQYLPTHKIPRDSQSSSSSRNVQLASERLSKRNPSSLVHTQITLGLPQQTGKILEESKSDSMDLNLSISSKLGSSKGSATSVPKFRRSRSPIVPSDKKRSGNKRCKNHRDFSP